MRPVRFLLPLLSLLAAPPLAAGTAPRVHDRLSEALLCRVDPLQVIDAIDDGGSRFDQGYAVTRIGEEIETQVLVILESALTLGGARTNLVRGGPSAPESGFGGLVYGRFRGDYRTVVQELGLQLVAGEREAPIGRFERRMPTSSDGDRQTVCPMVIGLTPLEGEDEGEFLLGCGWCNG